MKLRILLGSTILIAAAVTAALAPLAGAASGTCTGTPTAPGLVQPGTYTGYTVTGTCLFAPGSVTIYGNLTIAPGASLNAHAATFALVHVTGNVLVGAGGTVGLGKYGAPFGPQTGTVVDGSVIADQPASLYLSAITVQGSLLSNGGSGPGLNFPIKDDVFGGNVIVQGWSGLWIGLFRNHVGGSLIFSGNTGTQIGDNHLPDSSEIVDNTVGGNLVCQGNTPAAQIGDSGGGPNHVAGRAIGECATLAG